MKIFILSAISFCLCSVSLFSQSSTGPDCPEISGNTGNGTISLTLLNLPSSNNYNESYNYWDQRIHAADSTWDFEGYLVYQLDSCGLRLPFEDFMFDTSYARLVAQCDLSNGITTLIKS